MNVDPSEVLENMIEEASHIRVEGDFIVLDFRYEYSIHKDRIRTPKQVLEWTLHLSQKNWITASRLAHFAQVAFKEIGIEAHK